MYVYIGWIVKTWGKTYPSGEKSYGFCLNYTAQLKQIHQKEYTQRTSCKITLDLVKLFNSVENSVVNFKFSDVMSIHHIMHQSLKGPIVLDLS